MQKLAGLLIVILALQTASCQAEPTPTPTVAPTGTLPASPTRALSPTLTPPTLTPQRTVTLVTATGAPPTAIPSPTQSSRRAIIDNISNQVDTRASTSGTFASAKIGDVLAAGSQTRTASGSEAKLSFGDGTFVHLAQNTILTIAELGIADGAPLTRLQIESGRMWIGQFGGVLEIRTPAGTAASRGSYADLQGLSNGQVLYYIIYGNGAFANTNLTTRQGLRISPGGQPTLVQVSTDQILEFGDNNFGTCGTLEQALGMRKWDVCGRPQDAEPKPTPESPPTP
jgi:FecR-like protein